METIRKTTMQTVLSVIYTTSIGHYRSIIITLYHVSIIFGRYLSHLSHLDWTT